MSSYRPAIPEAVKREVRQQSKFGCVICGMPFYEYEHIEEYSKEKQHTSDNIILLCPNHHSSKTTKKLSKERLNYLKQNPYNLGKNFSNIYKLEPATTINIKLGSNTCSWTLKDNPEHYILWINGISYFSLHNEDNWLTFSLNITDNMGKELLKIHKGEIQIRIDIFDFTYEGQTIIIKDKQNENIILKMKLADNTVEIQKGIIMDNSGDGFIINNKQLKLIIDQNSVATFSRCYWGNNYTGSIGLLNTKKRPVLATPKGFGFMYRPESNHPSDEQFGIF